MILLFLFDEVNIDDLFIMDCGSLTLTNICVTSCNSRYRHSRDQSTIGCDDHQSEAVEICIHPPTLAVVASMTALKL